MPGYVGVMNTTRSEHARTFPGLVSIEHNVVEQGRVYKRPVQPKTLLTAWGMDS